MKRRIAFAAACCGLVLMLTGCPSVDPCADVDCGPHGACVDGACVCTEGYSGGLCDVPPLENTVTGFMTIGVEYAQQGVGNGGLYSIAADRTMARVYGDMGARLVKPIDATARMDRIVGGIDWDLMDPLAGLADPGSACSDASAYDWQPVDDAVRDYLAEGFDALIVLSPAYRVYDPWPRKSNKPPSMYSAAETACYENYVRNVVERYDGDGTADMAGLPGPVRYWQIEEEYQTGFFDNPVGSQVWQDPAEEYITLLSLAVPVVDAAYSNPDPAKVRKIIAIPMQMRGIFWHLTEAGIDSAITDYLSRYRSGDATLPKSVLNILNLFLGEYGGGTLAGLADIVSTNSIDDWQAGVLAPARFMARIMHEGVAAGVYDRPKPIWISDLSYSADPMLYLGLGPRAVPPYVDAQVPAIKAYLDVLNEGTYGARTPNPADPDNPDDPANKAYAEYLEYLAWQYAQQARFTAKAIVAGTGEGVEAMHIYSTRDSGWRANVLGGKPYYYAGTYGWCGMVDTTNVYALEMLGEAVAVMGVGEDLDGDGTVDVNRDDDADPRRPVYYMVQDLVRRLSPYESHRRAYIANESGAAGTIFAYEFTAPAGDEPSPLTVVWYEDGSGQLPGDAMPRISDFRMTVPGATETNVAIVPVITERTRTGPVLADERAYELVSDGRVQFSLDKTPVLVYCRP